MCWTRRRAGRRRASKRSCSVPARWSLWASPTPTGAGRPCPARPSPAATSLCSRPARTSGGRRSTRRCRWTSPCATRPSTTTSRCCSRRSATPPTAAAEGSRAPMTASMGPNRYGKDGIRLVLVRRGRSHDEPNELNGRTVDVRLKVDFDAAHTEGDNAPVLETDMMRSTSYALDQEHLSGSIEVFGAALARRYLLAATAAGVAEVTLRE